MTTTEIVQIQPGFMAPVVSVQNALNAYQAKKDLIDGIMKSGVDFGVIPGSSKPTLLKAGAEKATSFFGLFPRFVDAEVINDWTGEQHGGEPFFFYRRTCNLWRGDVLVASVDGSCNSWEKKYRYRGGERVCPNCGKATIIKGKAEYGGGWLCFAKKGGCGTKFEDTDTAITGQEIGQVKNPDVSDLVNTILKMADKRALVAATLIATGLSEYFTQDIEDYTTGGEIVEGVVSEAKHTEPPAVGPDKPAQSLTGLITPTAFYAKVKSLGLETKDGKEFLAASGGDFTAAYAKLIEQHQPPAGPDVGDGENLPA